MTHARFSSCLASVLVIGSVWFLVGPWRAEAVPSDAIIAAWRFEGKGNQIEDTEGKSIHGTIQGNAKRVPGVDGNGLQFDGQKDLFAIPDSAFINTGGPYTDRTITALFFVEDANESGRKQTIFEEGGRTRGLVLYVFDGEAWVGGWNRAEYNWRGAWISAPIESKTWYHIALVLRNAGNKVEKDRFEMWLDGELIAKEPGGQLFSHGDDIGIGAVNQNTVFHDEDGAGTNIHHFEGIIDEVWMYRAALSEKELRDQARNYLAVRAAGKLATRWGALKAR